MINNSVADFYSEKILNRTAYHSVFDPEAYSLLRILDIANTLRQKYWGNSVTIHTINNAQNGHCPEDCNYCAQSKIADTPIERYPLKSDETLMSGADEAYAQGSYRYCIVVSGRGPTPTKLNTLCQVIRRIKDKYPNKEVCLSAGLITDDMAIALKQAGLDRLNHNLNTPEDNYATICTTHTYADRMATLRSAQKAGLTLCSGIIVGLGESIDDLITMALKFRELNVSSIPINFLIPIPDTPFETATELSPDYCLRLLALFRLINPTAEIRLAAGREYHLKSMQALGLYAANSLFMDGYLNTTGTSPDATIQLIQDAGFSVHDGANSQITDQSPTPTRVTLKTRAALRP